jgi:formate hydrogenlyase transcriptional activator
VAYTAKGNVLPVRHVLVLKEKSAPSAEGDDTEPEKQPIPGWVQDYALFLVDVDGRIVTWYAGAERIYGYTAAEAIGQHVSFLHPSEDAPGARLEEEFRRSAAAGHYGNEGWRKRKDETPSWANAITMALKDANGTLRGFAKVVRDFSDRHERDEKLRRSRARIQPITAASTITGVVAGEFDCIPEVNDTFLDLVGYSRADLLAGRMNWADLTPPEFAALDELAHEEGLRFGACARHVRKS